MFKISIVREDGNGEEKTFDPIGSMKRGFDAKMKDYYENPQHMVIDITLLGAATIAVERLGYGLNAVTRAVRTARNR